MGGAQGSPSLAELKEACQRNFSDVMVRSFTYETGHSGVDCSRSDRNNLYSLLSKGYTIWGESEKLSLQTTTTVVCMKNLHWLLLKTLHG